jgi:hypothetical protein
LPWLADVIERAAAQELPPGARLVVAGAELSLGDASDPAPGLRLSGLRLAGPDGALLARARRVRVDLQPLPLLLGDLRLTSLVVVGPIVRVARLADGRIRLGVAQETGVEDDAAPEPDNGGGAGLSAILQAASPDARGPLATLRTVRLIAARLRFEDAASGRASAVADGALGPTLARVEAEVAADASSRLRLSFSGVAADDVATLAPRFAVIRALSAPVQGRIEASFDPAARMTAASARIRAAAGALDVEGVEAPFDGAAIEASYDPARDRLAVDSFELRAAFGSASGSAVATVARGPDGGPVGAEGDVALDSLVVSDPAAFAAPQRFDALRTAWRVRTSPLRLEAAHFEVAQGPLVIEGRGAATLGDDGWSGELAATGRGLEAPAIAALWPVAAAPGARRWIVENLEAGAVDRFDAAARFGGGGDALGLTFSFRDAIGHYFRPLPPIENASGFGEATLDAFTLTLDAGKVRPAGGGEVALSGSVFSIPDLNHPKTPAEISVHGEGPIAAILETLDSPPLGFVGKLGLDPRSVGGTARADARLALPLLRDLPLEAVDVSATADLIDVSVTPPGTTVPIESDALSLSADASALRLSGPVRIAGAEAEATWREVFAPAPGETRTSVALRGTVTAAQAAALGLDPRPHLDGAARFDASITRDAAEATSFSADLDLAQNVIDAAPVDWRKPAGPPAKARVEGRLADGGVVLDRLALDAPDLSARASVALGPDGALRRLDVTRARVGDGLDLSVRLRRDGAGYAARIEGALLDLSALDAGGGGPAPETGPPISAELALDTLRLDTRLALRGVSGSASRSASGAVSADLRADAGGPVRVRYDEAGGDAKATLSAANAGALLRSMDLFSEGLGGALAVDASLRGPRVTGELRIDDMVIAGDPTLTRLLSEAQIAEAPREGTRFTRIRAPFTLDGDTLTLNEAIAVGPSVGVSISGDYDLAVDRLDMSGVFSPAFALNSAVGAIPLVGQLLTGGEGRGLVAFNFGLTGPVENPDISVNPLSVLAPGIVRRLFEALPGAGAPVDPSYGFDPGQTR